MKGGSDCVLNWSWYNVKQWLCDLNEILDVAESTGNADIYRSDEIWSKVFLFEKLSKLKLDSRYVLK